MTNDTMPTQPAPTENKILDLFLEFSGYLHSDLPDGTNGCERGMVELKFDAHGQLCCGPFWLSRDETDEIVKHFLRSKGVLHE